MVKKYISEIRLLIVYSLFVTSILENSIATELKYSNTWVNVVGTGALGYGGFLLVEYLIKKGIKQIDNLMGIIIGAINGFIGFGLAYFLGNIFNNYYRLSDEFGIPFPYIAIGLSVFSGYLATTPVKKYVPIIVFILAMANSFLSDIV